MSTIIEPSHLSEPDGPVVRVPPPSNEIEQSVLGGLLTDIGMTQVTNLTEGKAA